MAGWDTLTSADAPLVGTFHCYSESALPHKTGALLGARRKLNRLNVSIAVSEAAAWTGRRFYGGRYRIIPNGVVLPDGGVPAPRARAAGEPLRIVFVGQAVERKGLPVLLRAFEALRGQIPAELTVIGLTPEELAPLLVEGEGVTALGRVDDAVKAAVLHDADVLCAPSLGGESFGMVLTEAFAAGTPVVASDIAGYRDVVSAGVDGLLVPRGNATALAETLRDLALDPARVDGLARGAAVSRRALRVAAGGRAGRDGLRGRDRRAGAGDRDAPCRGEDRRAARGRPAARARACACRPWSRRRSAGGARPCGAGRSAWRASRPSSAPCWRSITSGRPGSATRSCARVRPGCCSAWR